MMRGLQMAGPSARRVVACLGVVVCLAALGCGARTEPIREAVPPWDLSRAETVEWASADPSFAQNYAIEASGMATDGSRLFIPSEKYSRLLIVDPKRGDAVGVVRLDVPRHTELEGVAVCGGSLFLCDEAHAAVYEVAAGEGGIEDAIGGLPVEVRRLDLEGVDVRGGKTGFEGILIDPVSGEVLLLLERAETATGGCVSRIFRLSRAGSSLVALSEPVEVRLEDCAWRLTALAWWHDRLMALKTQFPGERYEIVAVDLASGETQVLLDLTDFLRDLGTRGWSNNVEGLAVTADGSVWLVADNAETGVIDDPLPPPIDVRTLLLRIPPSANR